MPQTDDPIRGPIALDGPVASGKTTIGNRIAARLGWPFIDTGLMYRAVGYLAETNGLPLDDAASLARKADEADINVDGNRVVVDGQEVGALLLTPEIARAASRVAALPEVRTVLVARQRQLAADAQGKVVMVGRDITTVVLSDAPVKIYLDAPPEERAQRRLQDETARGHTMTYDHVLRDLETRDRRDMGREASPLQRAADATVVQTGGLTIEQVVDTVLAVAHTTSAS